MKQFIFIALVCLFPINTLCGQNPPRIVVDWQTLPNTAELCPENREELWRNISETKKMGQCVISADDMPFWRDSMKAIREKYMRKEQMDVLEQFPYLMQAQFIFDYHGNVVFLNVRMDFKFYSSFSKEQLDNIYKALWSLKFPLRSMEAVPSHHLYSVYVGVYPDESYGSSLTTGENNRDTFTLIMHIRDNYLKYMNTKQAIPFGIRMPIAKYEWYFPYAVEDPSWNSYAVNRNDTLLTVDVDMTDCIAQDYVLKENWEAYKETGQPDFYRSHSRYIYTRHLVTGKTDAFYMTLVPSAEYVRNQGDRVRFNTYLNRDKHLSGYVLFHTLYGVFINGWEYNDGKITGRVLPPKMVTDSVNTKPLWLGKVESGYYVVSKPDKRSHMADCSEENLMRHKGLPDMEIIPVVKPASTGLSWDNLLPVGSVYSPHPPVVVPSSGDGNK